ANWSQFIFVTSTVTWAWADREAARAKMAIKATQTHFRSIRILLSRNRNFSQSDPSVYRFCQPLGRYSAGSGAKMRGTPDIGGKRWATYVGLRTQGSSGVELGTLRPSTSGV